MNMKYEIITGSDYGSCALCDSKIVFKSDVSGEVSFFAEFDFGTFKDKYLLLPSCIYDGNPIKIVKRPYPPLYTREDLGVDPVEIISDLPSLGPDKDGSFEVTSGDLATPCFAVYTPSEKECMLVFTEQAVKGKNLGFSCYDGKMKISYPKMRKERYRLCRPHPESGDTGITVEEGEEVSSPVRIFVKPCESITELFGIYFDLRKCLLKSERAKNGYTKMLWDIMVDHFNKENYSGSFYGTAYANWTPGWTAGVSTSYALYKKGGETEKERAIQSVDYLVAHQAPSGFYYPKNGPDGEILGDSIGKDFGEFKTHHLIRKSADALYFLLKFFTLDGLEIKDEWIISAQKCAGAFCDLFNTYGKFGQFVDIITGEMVFGATSSGTLVPGDLALAYKYFGDEDYLIVAEKSADYYYENYLKKGYTNGGPGDALCAIDSESAFAFLESLVALYEVTGKEKYLKMAEECAWYCSTWVVSYSYDFPKTSMFGSIGINSVGAVYANIQNKHGAPGICTLSGDGLYKLWKFTGNEKYLELIKDIVSCMPQCVSREERPMYSWDDPPRKIPEGYINERVNMSDWETVGSVFYGACWCETSLILTYADLIDYPEFGKPEE